MSSSAKHRAWAHKESEALASGIVAELHNVEEPERHLAQRLFPLVRECQKLRYTQAEALGRLKAREKHVNFLVKAGALVHEQLVNVLAQRRVG